MNVLLIKVPIRKKSGNLLKAPPTSVFSCIKMSMITLFATRHGSDITLLGDKIQEKKFGIHLTS